MFALVIFPAKQAFFFKSTITLYNVLAPNELAFTNLVACPTKQSATCGDYRQ